MSGSASPKTCCDRDCAGANNCWIGGYQCKGCGYWFCADEIDDDGLCDECAEERRLEQEEEEE